MTFDKKCLALARAFLADEEAQGFPPPFAAEESALAGEIQRAIDAFLEERHADACCSDCDEVTP